MSARTETSPACVVVPAGLEHVRGMVACHVAAFPGEFLMLLGPRVLASFYAFYIRRPGGVAFVALGEDAGRVVGLVVGGEPALRASYTRRELPRLVGAVVWRAVTHARVRQRLGEHLAAGLAPVLRRAGLGRRGDGRPAPPTDPPGTWSSLLSVCTHPDWRGRGIGRELMEAFRLASRRRGYRTMRCSVHNDNLAAISLYERCGWEAVLRVPSGTYFRRSAEDIA